MLSAGLVSLRAEARGVGLELLQGLRAGLGLAGAELPGGRPPAELVLAAPPEGALLLLEFK